MKKLHIIAKTLYHSVDQFRIWTIPSNSSMTDKILYHCVVPINQFRIDTTPQTWVALCGHKFRWFPKQQSIDIFDFIERWNREYDDTFFNTYKRCQACMNHEDYTLYMLACYG